MFSGKNCFKQTSHSPSAIQHFKMVTTEIVLSFYGSIQIVVKDSSVFINLSNLTCMSTQGVLKLYGNILEMNDSMSYKKT